MFRLIPASIPPAVLALIFLSPGAPIAEESPARDDSAAVKKGSPQPDKPESPPAGTESPPKQEKKALPAGFRYLEDVEPTIQQDIRYAGANNFVGEVIPGYQAPRAILTAEACLALKKVQDELRQNHLSLKVFDAYRPKRAVRHFVNWSSLKDERKRPSHYPAYTKAELFQKGFISRQSGHSRGSTVDLTIVDQKTGKELPMGTPFDFFDERSTDATTEISKNEQENRQFLRGLMRKHGFLPYRKEWWHFRLKDEPFPKTYFDFVVQ